MMFSPVPPALEERRKTRSELDAELKLDTMDLRRETSVAPSKRTEGHPKASHMS